MKPEDLLNIEKMTELNAQVGKMETLGNKEIIKTNKPKDNAYDLNRLNTDYDGIGMTEDEAMEREHDKEVDDFRDAEDRNLSDLANR